MTDGTRQGCESTTEPELVPIVVSGKGSNNALKQWAIEGQGNHHVISATSGKDRLFSIG